MTHVFRHPKFYRIPRDKEEARAQLKVPSSNSDQAISESTHDGESERAPGPGLMKSQATSKSQAASIKLSNQPVQSPSDKRPNQSNKRQASSPK